MSEPNRSPDEHDERSLGPATSGPSKSRDSVYLLVKSGRHPSWHLLTAAQQKAYEQEHVDLMLATAEGHGMRRFEGFKLIGPQQPWARFWVTEWPDLEGAEAWVEAELRPPYGAHAHFEYFVARSCGPEYFSSWVTNPAPPIVPRAADPHDIPAMDVDRNSVVILLFGRHEPGGEAVPAEVRDDAGHVALMKRVAHENGMLRMEGFQLIDLQAGWHRAWLMEFPTLEGCEAWIDNEILPPHGAYARKQFFLTRRWAPEYCASWVAPQFRR